MRKKEKEDDRAFKKSLLSLKAKHGSKRKLSSKDVTNINEGNTIPNMLLDIRKVISSNKNSFGPVLGRASSYNPYDEKAQTIDSEMRAVSQAFGRYMEGGVLRKEDEEKYRKMFPKLADTPAVAANRLDVVQRLLMNKQKSNLKAYAAQGFDIRGLDMKGKAPELPSIIRGGEGSKTEMANQVLMEDKLNYI